MVSSLSCQLAETKAELVCSRQLNERLSNQLDCSTKQLSDAMQKFIKFEENKPRTLASTTSLETKDMEQIKSSLDLLAREMIGIMSDFRKWLPDGMAAAAVAAVNTRLSCLSISHSSLGVPFVPNADSITSMQLCNPNWYGQFSQRSLVCDMNNPVLAISNANSKFLFEFSA